jgi:hypothetical protein
MEDHMRRFSFVAIFLLVALAKGAVAAHTPPASQPDSDLLAGPKVEQEATEQTIGRRGTPNNTGQRRAEPLGPRAWFNAVRQLDLTAEQQQQMATIISEMQETQRAYQAEHGDRERELQAQARGARQAGKEPDAKVREELQKIEAARPKPLDFQRRIWNLLTEDQQATLRARVAELEKQMNVRGRDGAQRATDVPMEPSTTDDQKPAEMKPANDAAMNPRNGEDRPTMRERLRQRRRGGPDVATDGLDDLARRRTEFLVAHQSVDHAGNAPMPQERSFRFKEDPQD